MADVGAIRRFRVAHAEQIVGGVALLGILFGTLVVVIAAAQGNSFLSGTIRGNSPGWLTWPFGGLWRARTNDHTDLQVGLLVVTAAMLPLYGLAIWLARRMNPVIVWSAVVAIHVVCFLSPPLLLTDVFNYIGYARMGVLHHLNPYTHLPVDISGDPVFKFNNWHHLPSPYGPLFTLFTYALVPLGLAGSYWAYKFIVALVSLACLVLVARIARRLGVPALPAVVLVGLNPLVILYGMGGQHNDVFQLVFLLGAIELTLMAKEQLGAAAMVGAAAMKASAALLLPILVLGPRRRERTITGAAAGLVLLGALWVAAFGPHLPSIGIQASIVTPFSIPNLFGLLIGRGGSDVRVRQLMDVVLIGGVVACTYYAWRTHDVIRAVGWLTIVTIATLSWDMAWYMLWLLPFIAFVRDRWFRTIAISIVVFMSLQWMPYFTQGVHALGFNPTHTVVWKQNARYIVKKLR